MKFSGLLHSLALCGAVLALTGCLTSKKSTVKETQTTNASGVVSTTFATNSVITVNQAALDLEAGVLQGVTSLAVTITLQKDPAALEPIQDAQTALSGLINGATTNSISQIMEVAGAKNATLQTELAPLVQQASELEQQLIGKYGATIAGEISLAQAKALNLGITAALPKK